MIHVFRTVIRNFKLCEIWILKIDTLCVFQQQNQSSTHSHTQPEAEKSSDKRSIISNNSAVSAVSSSKLLLPSAHLPPTSNTGCPAKVFSSVGSACSTASAAKEAMYSHHQASASVSGPSKSSWSCRDQIQNTTSSKWQLYFFFLFHNGAKICLNSYLSFYI